jgi:hypothetical protein
MNHSPADNNLTFISGCVPDTHEICYSRNLIPFRTAAKSKGTYQTSVNQIRGNALGAVTAGSGFRAGFQA